MRLQKFLSRSGTASRRASERLIADGRVRVDGRVVTVQGTRILPGISVVEVDGKRVSLPPPMWLALHKPVGYLCSRGDPQGPPTVYDLIPRGEQQRLFHVGRLDYMSEGLLLLTNEGDIAHRLLHPSAATPRRYAVTLSAPVPRDLPQRLLAGVELEDGRVCVDTATLLRGSRNGEELLVVTVHEGKNREVRRMMQRVGVVIRSLKRLALGPVELGDLPRGAHRELTADEVRQLRETAGKNG